MIAKVVIAPFHRDDRRRQNIERLPNGRLVDRDVMRDYLASLDRPRTHIERLSLTDPVVVAGSKGRPA